MDKNYDLIFIVGNVDENVELENAHENYRPIFETTVVSKKESLNNQITILCSKPLLAEDLIPMEKDANIDSSELTEDFTMNSKIFILFGY